MKLRTESMIVSGRYENAWVERKKVPPNFGTFCGSKFLGTRADVADFSHHSDVNSKMDLGDQIKKADNTRANVAKYIVLLVCHRPQLRSPTPRACSLHDRYGPRLDRGSALDAQPPVDFKDVPGPRGLRNKTSTSF